MGAWCGKEVAVEQPGDRKEVVVKQAGDHKQSSCAVAFTGGGFLAFASATGLTTGLLHTLGKKKHNVATLDMLFQNFDVVAAVSGGTWYTAELAYTDQLPALLNLMVVDIQNSGALFNAEWTRKLLNGSNSVPEKVELQEALTDAIQVGGIPVGELLHLISVLLQNSEDVVNWSDFTDLLLQSTSGLNVKNDMGSSSNSWAHGKLWVVGTSIVTPNGANGTVGITQQLPGWKNPHFAKLSYHMKGVSDCAKFSPAAFNWRFGSDDDRAPRAFSAVEDNIQYHGSSDFTATSLPLGEVHSAAITEHTGKLPIGQVVAASSAFAGQLILTPALKALLSNRTLDLNVWLSSAPAGSAFEVAQQVLADTRSNSITAEQVDRVAQNALHTVIDGGFTDGTGIAHSIAAGADVVVSIQIALDWMYKLFEGGGDDSGCGSIFKESVDRVKEQEESFTCFDIPDECKAHLSKIGFGTIRATTVDNKYWGIKADKIIAIKVIYVESDAGIGGTSDFYDYGVLVGHIARTMAHNSNESKAQTLLHDFFLEPGSRAW